MSSWQHSRTDIDCINGECRGLQLIKNCWVFEGYLLLLHWAERTAHLYKWVKFNKVYLRLSVTKARKDTISRPTPIDSLFLDRLQFVQRSPYCRQETVVRVCSRCRFGHLKNQTIYYKEDNDIDQETSWDWSQHKLTQSVTKSCKDALKETHKQGFSMTNI